MKKTILLSLTLCLILGSVLGFVFVKDGLSVAFATAEPVEAAEDAQTAAAEEKESAGRIDFKALYALHEPDEIVLTVGEREVSWGEYFYFLYRQATSVESYFDNMTLYNLDYGWDDTVSEDGPETFAEYVAQSAEIAAQSISAMESYARSHGVEISEEGRAAIEEKMAEDYLAACGEGATREDFEAYLRTIYMPAAFYDYINEVSVLFQDGFTTLYGNYGEKFSDEETLAWMEEQGYMSANHILRLTMDLSTREPLDEETKAEQLAQAQAIADELRAIEDRDALLARFAELKEEYDEDSGKTAYPNGYLFTPGQMVSEFEEAVKSQEAYQVSEPVESAYGYHVILTLPLDPDAVVETSSNGTPTSARAVAASEAYTAAVDAYALEQEIVWREGCEAPDLLAFVK